MLFSSKGDTRTTMKWEEKDSGTPRFLFKPARGANVSISYGHKAYNAPLGAVLLRMSVFGECVCV